jgi:hypothetical protein
MRTHIAGLDLASCPCPRKWPWTSGNGGCPGLLPFSADRLEMTSKSLVEIREAAISTCPPFPPPTGGPAFAERRRPAQGRRGRADCGSAVSSSVFASNIPPWQSPTDRNHPLPEWPTFRPEHLFGCFPPTRSSGCWRSTGFTWRRNTTKVTARIFHQPI